MKTILFVIFVSAVNAALYDRHLSLIDENLIEKFDEENLKADWERFKIEHNKEYENEEHEKLRMKIFAANRLKIAQHNELYEKGVESYSMGMNQFGDLESHEFAKLMLTYNATHDEADFEDVSTFIGPDSDFLYPRTVDWRTKGIVTGVKDQGACGSCWAFASIGALEGQHARKIGRLVSLSEQNLIDCSTSYGNSGCNGGYISQSYRYIKENKGIDTEKSYPYEIREGSCRYKKRFSGATVTGYTRLEKSEERLKIVVATKGPVAVGVDATNFQLYDGRGVYYDKHCSQEINHSVLVVGYGHDKKGGDYWLIKNSWGASWGDHGYIKMARNRGNNCNVASQAFIPQV